MTSPTKVCAVSLLLLSCLSTQLSSPATALQNSWPSCTTEAQVECVESLTYTTHSGTFNVSDPGGELPPGAPLVQRTAPYVLVTPPNTAIAGSTLSFTVLSPTSTELAPNVRSGLEEGTYSFVIRLGSYDPTQTGLSAEPVSITPSQRPDGTFTLSVVVRPKPVVRVMSAASHAACKVDGWTCDGESGVVRNISGFVFQNLIPANRPLFRGLWVATNASEFSIPSISTLTRSVSASVAGPHTVPAGFPTAGLTMENGKGVNPAFYKLYVPYSIIEAMLSMAPAEIRSTLTPAMVRAKITEASSQKDQPVALTMGESGMTIDLGITHFSAPNPEVTFLTPSQVAAPAQSTPVSGAQRTYSKGKTYPVSTMVSIPSGHKVTRIVVARSSVSVCSASGVRIRVKKAGTCSFSVVTAKKSTSRTIKGKVKVG